MEYSTLLSELRSFGHDFDHINQEIILNSALETEGVEGLVCEIGFRQGGGLAMMLLAMNYNNDSSNRTFIAVDPYGNIAYKEKDGVTLKLDYTNSMKHDNASKFYAMAGKKNVNFLFFPLEDTEFFSRFGDGVPIYKEYKTIESKYALVHVDGPHDTESVLVDAEFFIPRMSTGGILIFDDITGYYNHTIVEEYVLQNGFELYQKDYLKAAYKKL